MVDTIKKSTDIYKGKEKEVIKKLSDIGYDKESIKKRLEKLKLNEKVNQKLSGLEAGSENHINYLKSLLEKEQKSIKEQAKDKIEETKNDLINKAEEKTEEVIETAKKGLMSKFGIDKIMDKFTGMFDNISGLFDSIWKKIMAALAGTGIGAFFGFKSEEKEEIDKTTKKEKNIQTKEVEVKKEIINKESKTEKNIITNNNDNIDSKKEIYYIAGIKTLLSLSGIKKENNTYSNGILKNISQNKYETITNLEESQKNQYLDTSSKKETLNTIIEQLKSKNFITLANYTFDEDRLKNIIKDNNGNINKKLAENITGGETRLKEILEKANNAEYNWWEKELSIAEIALLYENSFNIFKLPNIKIKSAIGGFLFNSEELKETDNDFVSKKIITNFTSSYQIDFGGKDVLEQDEDVIKKVGENLNKSEKEQLENIIKFKDYVLYNGFLENITPNFSEEQKQNFKNNIDYKWIISLYSIMGGKEFNKDSNIINKLSLTYLNSKIIGGFEGSKYIGDIAYKIISEDQKYFSKEELNVLSIYKDKAFDISIGYNLSQIGKKLGLATGVTGIDLDNLALGLGVGGLGINVASGKLISKAIGNKKISILGMLGKKLGWLGMLSGIAIGGYSFYNKEHIKSDDLKEDIEKAGDDAKKILEILKKYNESISKPIVIDGKNISIIKYKNDTPLVIMEGKVYTFDIIDIPLLEKIKNTDYSDSDSIKKTFGDAWDYGKNGILDIIASKNGDVEINGVNINTSDIKIKGDKIIFGDNKEYYLVDLFNGISTKKLIKDEDIRIKFKKFIEENNTGYTMSSLGGKTANFYKLKKLGDGKFISLVQIGENNPLKNGD